MGYMTAFGECIICKQFFGFNPDKVPSLRVNGTREPVCGGCMETINKQRAAKGLEPFAILPDAYEPERID